MADQMTDVSARLRFEEQLLIYEWEREVELSRIHDWLREALGEEVNLTERLFIFPSILLKVFVSNSSKQVRSPFFQNV